MAIFSRLLPAGRSRQALLNQSLGGHGSSEKLVVCPWAGSWLSQGLGFSTDKTRWSGAWQALGNRILLGVGLSFTHLLPMLP